MKLKGKVLSIIESSYQTKMAVSKGMEDTKGFCVLIKILSINELDYTAHDLVAEIGVCSENYSMLDLFAWLPREGKPVEKAKDVELKTPVWKSSDGVSRKVQISSGDKVELEITKWFEKYSKPRSENDNKSVRMVTGKGSRFISVKRPLFLHSSGTPVDPDSSTSSSTEEQETAVFNFGEGEKVITR